MFQAREFPEIKFHGDQVSQIFMKIIQILIFEIFLQEDNGIPLVLSRGIDRMGLFIEIDKFKGVPNGIPLLGKANKQLIQEIQLFARLTLQFQGSTIPKKTSGAK
jgi:hypothetical protein